MRPTAVHPLRHEAVPWAVSGLFGLLWYVWVGGAHTLWPTNLGWLMTGDWATHELGFLFYRNEPLFRLPLGEVRGLLHPVGTSVGYTDSMPWLALLGRVFSGVLPTSFQYIGPWLGLCFVLQGFLGARLVALVTPGRVAQVLGGVLFVINPVLLLRLGHDALCAHWLLLAALHLNLAPMPEERSWRRGLWTAFGLTVFSAGIHPYLNAMVTLLAVAFAVRVWVEGPAAKWRKRAVGLVVGSALASNLVFLGFGYFSGAVSRDGWGFGTFSADLATFINPMAWSRWLSPRPLGPYQYEGIAYLGVGIFGLLLAGLGLGLARVREVRALPWRRALPVLVAAFVLAVFAAANSITFDGKEVLDLRAVYVPLAKVVGPFRSSGRFIWPLYYLIVTAAVLVVARLTRPLPGLVGPALLGFALVVQVAELEPVSARKVLRGRVFTPPAAPAWETVGGHFDHLALFPAQVVDTCGAYDPSVAIPFGFLAYRLKLTFNSGYFARVNAGRTRAACQAQAEAVTRGELDPRTVYVVDGQAVSLFQRNGATCGGLDGQVVCVAASAAAPFRSALAAPR